MNKIIPFFMLIAVSAAYGGDFTPWPEATTHGLSGDRAVIGHTKFKIVYTIPDDPNIQIAGGSGGPISLVELYTKSGEKVTSFTAQSVGGWLLEDSGGYPQFEIWSRAGGGSWCRSLYRYSKNKYSRIRTDEFHDYPDRATRKDITAHLPGDKATLYYVKTRIPKEQN